LEEEREEETALGMVEEEEEEEKEGEKKDRREEEMRRLGKRRWYGMISMVRLRVIGDIGGGKVRVIVLGKSSGKSEEANRSGDVALRRKDIRAAWRDPWTRQHKGQGRQPER
jgi:hypothetical protein